MNRLRSKTENPNSSSDSSSNRKSQVAIMLQHLVDGTLLEGVVSKKNLPFTLFLILIIGFYIANTYNAERTIRSTAKIEKEVKELSSEYISMKSDLMFISNQSQVAQRVAALKLKEAKTPPHKLFTNPKNQDQKTQ